MRLAHAVYGFHKTQAVEFAIYDQDYNKWKGIRSFNLNRWFTHGRQQLIFLVAMAQVKQGAWERHGRRLGKARTQSIGHHLLNRKLLRNLGDMGNPLYSLVEEKTGHERPAVTAQFGWTSTGIGAPSGSAPAPKITSAATVQAGALLQATNWREGLRWSGSMVAGSNGEGGLV
jgi:hypothetical protein